MVTLITNKQLNLFKIFGENIFGKYTYNQIKIGLNEKSNSFLIEALKKFKELNLIKEEKINNSKCYYLNLENDLIYNYLEILNSGIYENRIIEKIILNLKSELNKYLFNYSIVVFGSYSVNKQNKNSDLDIAIFVENKLYVKEILNLFERVKLRSLIELDLHLISKYEFLDMLTVDYSNLGKMIFQKHKCIFNCNLFYNILKEGYKNGFRS